jgi:nucleotide-binding universal stress UspA family protein
MKVLLAYDGSKCSESAIDDLVRAGLPSDTECAVISVAEVWLPPTQGNGEAEELDPFLEKLVRKQRESGEKAVEEARAFAKHATARLKKMFPGWCVRGDATYGSPAWEILNKADEMKPDLIVVGSHGQSAISRFLLGSISQKVLTVAHSSVRIARGRIEVDPAPVRIVIGFDGTRGAKAAVDAVASRCWPQSSEVKLVAATDPISPSAIGRFVPPVNEAVEEINESEHEWLRATAEPAIEKLEARGLKVELQIIPGHAKRVLTEVAGLWTADCIFLGANSFGSRLERYLIGSTSAAVAARAHCSVEVVRLTPDATTSQ